MTWYQIFLATKFTFTFTTSQLLVLLFYFDGYTDDDPFDICLIEVVLKITFKFFTEVLFLSIILCLANTGIVNVLVSTLYSKPDEVTGSRLNMLFNAVYS